MYSIKHALVYLSLIFLVQTFFWSPLANAGDANLTEELPEELMEKILIYAASPKAKLVNRQWNIIAGGRLVEQAILHRLHADISGLIGENLRELLVDKLATKKFTGIRSSLENLFKNLNKLHDTVIINGNRSQVSLESAIAFLETEYVNMGQENALDSAVELWLTAKLPATDRRKIVDIFIRNWTVVEMFSTNVSSLREVMINVARGTDRECPSYRLENLVNLLEWYLNHMSLVLDKTPKKDPLEGVRWFFSDATLNSIDQPKPVSQPFPKIYMGFYSNLVHAITSVECSPSKPGSAKARIELQKDRLKGLDSLNKRLHFLESVQRTIINLRRINNGTLDQGQLILIDSPLHLLSVIKRLNDPLIEAYILDIIISEFKKLPLELSIDLKAVEEYAGKVFQRSDKAMEKSPEESESMSPDESAHGKRKLDDREADQPDAIIPHEEASDEDGEALDGQERQRKKKRI